MDMTALLPASDNTEKIAQYAEEARRMGVESFRPTSTPASARFTV